MSWGCYKHEVDAGSENWQEKMSELCQNQLDDYGYQNWGRQLAICPWCYSELKISHEQMLSMLKKIRSLIKNHTLGNPTIMADEWGDWRLLHFIENILDGASEWEKPYAGV